MRLKHDRIFCYGFAKNLLLSLLVKVLKIGQQWAKLEARAEWHLFFRTRGS